MLENIGRYRILSPLGKGAMGVVYLADDPVLNRQVAVKTIDLDIDDPARREFLRGRLLRDARAAAALTHVNIVSVFDVVEDGDTAAIIMEYVAGEDLSGYLSRNPVADTAFTSRIIRAMAAALDYTHSRGVIHRDIKPANVMLDAALTPKITDFGIARITEGVTTTMTGVVMGTIEYMAPEQVKGEKADGRADQFALGVVAYRMLTGQSLFGDHSLATLAYKIVNEAPTPACSHNAGLPPAMDAVFAKVLAKDPNSRYPSCSEFAEALAGALAGRSREVPTVAMPAPAAPPSRSKLPVLALGVFAAGAAIAGLVMLKPWAPAPSTPGSQNPASSTAQTQTPAPQTQAQPAQTKEAPAQQAEAAPPLKAAAKSAGAPVERTETAGKEKAAKAEAKSAASDDEPDASDGSAPVPAVAAFNHGRDLMKSQDYNGAVQAFGKAVEIRPNWAQAYHSRGNAYQGLQQYDAALRDYSHAIRLNPSIPNFYVSRAETYVKTKQDDLALPDLTQAISLKADAPVALAARADIYIRREDFKNALTDLNQVILLQPQNAVAYRQRAVAKRALGDRLGARADVAKSVELGGRRGGG